MLARFAFGLVAGLLMYVPRPIPRPPVDNPPSPDTPPPGTEDVPPVDLPDIDIEPPSIPLPDVPTPPDGPFDSYPSVPPTPPPGYEGEWPPASERADVPPTPPPGYEGDWPPSDVSPSPVRRLPFIHDLFFRPFRVEQPLQERASIERFDVDTPLRGRDELDA